jgi:alpha-1,3-glucan synthase
LSTSEYTVSYKNNITYADFTVSNKWDPNCDINSLSQFHNESGHPIKIPIGKGCYDSDFDHYGDLEAFGTYPPWQRQLSKFAGVQDRFRDWSPKVQPKLVKFTCLAIQGLDIDGIRVDKATQMTSDFVANVLSPGVRECARALGKTNFFFPGEITSGVDYGAIFVGKGRAPEDVFDTVDETFPGVNETGNGQLAKTMRSGSNIGLDSMAFSYSMYRSLLAFMNLKGNILSSYDVGPDPVQAFNYFLRWYDYSNAYNGQFDPRDLFVIGNQDTFRWASIEDGLSRFRLGQVITTLLLPGMPVVSF